MSQPTPPHSVASRGNGAFWLAALFILVLLSRIPFLTAGYGVNVDAWRVANAARHISQTGEYEVSRFPGNPIHEIASSLLWRGGPVALNGLLAIASAVAAMLMALIARKLKYKDYLLLGLAMAFVPVIYVSSVTAKDYVLALAFMLGSLYSLLEERPLGAGLLLGLAVGCRITAAAAVFPFCLLLIDRANRKLSVRQIAVFGAAFAVAAAGSFLPVFLRYGTSFFLCYANAYPDWQSILHRGTVEVWGWIGLGSIALGAISLAWNKQRLREIIVETDSARQVIVWATLVGIYLVAFLSLPDLAAYLIPVIPFILLLLGRFLERRILQVVCVSLVLGGFVSFDQNGFSMGAVFQDHRARQSSLKQLNWFVNFSRTIPGKTVFVVGGWSPEIENLYPTSLGGYPKYVYLMSPLEVLNAIRAGESIYYSSQNIREFNYTRYGFDLAQYGAKDAHVVLEQRMKEAKTSVE